MKIVSFNVNGIRAIIKKSFIEDFNNLDADIFALNETKFSGEDNFPFVKEGYDLYFTNSKVKKGYSGVAIYSKIKPISVHYGLFDNKYDDEGRVITLEFNDFYFVACYVPNAGEELKRMDFRMTFEDDLLAYLKDLDSRKPVIYTGDLNVAHNEIDLKNPKTNTNSAGFTLKERNAFSRLLENGFIDVFRNLYPNEIKYTWWSYRFKAREKNIGWRIDYFVTSKRLIDNVENMIIHNEILGSDHCPIELIINNLH